MVDYQNKRAKGEGQMASGEWRVKRGEWRMIGDFIKQKGRI
jgi:hypothetical protein